MIRFLKVFLLIVFTFHFVLHSGLFAQSVESDEIEPEISHEDLHIEPDRTDRLQTNEGTWMSLDVHPSGERIIFDFMGDLYELPVNGGDATRLTRGMAFDSQPRYSPDSDKVVFISDRSGGDNNWLLWFQQKEPDGLPGLHLLD